MTDLRVFRDLGSADGRLAFYTNETAHRIPEAPGCYAWFVPLWMYEQDLSKLIQVVRDLRSYDDPSERQVPAKFTWQSVDLLVSRTERVHKSSNAEATWKRLVSKSETRAALQRLLLEMSVLMPPLYVGRTNCLKRRYTEHVKDSDGNFHHRFTRHTENHKITLQVSDLLFACLRTDSSVNKDLSHIDDRALTGLIEHILMNACRPPFSIQ